MATINPNTFGTLDIGSNGVRLFIGKILRGRLQTLLDRRAALRLGQDSFSRGEISRRMIEKLVECFLEFRWQAHEYGVLHWRAVATSALRDARNGKAVVQELWQRTGIWVDVISGLAEAELLHLAIRKAIPLQGRSALLFDLGGGSLEVIAARGARVRQASSLRLGTVRLIQRFGSDAAYSRLRPIIHRELARLVQDCQDPISDLIQPELLIGTGGNLRALARLLARLQGRPANRFLRLGEVEYLTEILFQFSLPRRQKILGLKPNRADVICPASAIVLEIMRSFNFCRLQIPNVGIKNGVLWRLANEVRQPHLRVY